MALGDIFKVTVVFDADTAPGRQYTTGFYLRQQGAVGFNVGDIGPFVSDWWNNAGVASDEVKLTYGVDIALAEVTLRPWFPLSPTIASYVTGFPDPGTGGGQTAAPENSAILSLRTANIGRSYRGRMFLPPPSENFINQNLLQANAQDLALRTAQLFADLDQVQAGGWRAQAQVWSKLLSVATPVTSVKCDQLIRSQRRRALRVPAYETAPV